MFLKMSQVWGIPAASTAIGCIYSQILGVPSNLTQLFLGIRHWRNCWPWPPVFVHDVSNIMDCFPIEWLKLYLALFLEPYNIEYQVDGILWNHHVFHGNPALYLLVFGRSPIRNGGGWSDSKRGGPGAEVSCHSHQQAMAAMAMFETSEQKWLVVTGTWLDDFSIYWECHSPNNWRSPMFQRGRFKPPTREVMNQEISGHGMKFRKILWDLKELD
jgi:hypothetical protein